MKVKELLETLQNVDSELEVYSGTGDEYVNVVRAEDVNVQETDTGLKLLSIQGQGRLACFYEKKKAEDLDKALADEAKPLGLTVLTALLRAYLNSLHTSFLYKDTFESLLNEESLGGTGTISDETWATMLKDLEKEWVFVRMGMGWSFSHRRAGGP